MIKQLEAAAKKLAQKIGKGNLTRSAVCELAGVAEGSFSYVTKQPFREWLDGLDLPESHHPLTSTWHKGDQRKEQIINEAIRQACLKGYVNVKLADIADSLGLTEQAIQYHFKTKGDLYEAMMQYAIDNSYYDLVVQGIVNKHPIALSADQEFKTEAVRIALMS